MHSTTQHIKQYKNIQVFLSRTQGLGKGIFVSTRTSANGKQTSSVS